MVHQLAASGKQQSDAIDERENAWMGGTETDNQYAAGGSGRDQPGAERLDQLLRQILQSKTCQFYAHSQCKTCELGETKIQEPKSQRNESDQVVVPNLGSGAHSLCSLDPLRLETNDLITGAV